MYVFLTAQYVTSAAWQRLFNSAPTILTVNSSGRSLSAPLHTLMELHVIYPPYANLSLSSTCRLHHKIIIPLPLCFFHLLHKSLLPYLYSFPWLISFYLLPLLYQEKKRNKKHPLTVALLKYWVGESNKLQRNLSQFFLKPFALRLPLPSSALDIGGLAKCLW